MTLIIRGIFLLALPFLNNLNYLQETVISSQGNPTNSAPNPSSNKIDVISIYSDTYSNIPNTNFYANWNQSTNVSEVDINGNKTLKYSNFNYQGIELGSSIDASQMEYVHIDIWTEDATALNFELISPGPSISTYALTINNGNWLSFDIPLASFNGQVDINEIFQAAFNDAGSGNSPTIYIDNIYFYRTETSQEKDAYLSDLSVNGTTIEGFNPNKFDYTLNVSAGATNLPNLEAQKSNDDAYIDITQATSLPGIASAKVISSDSSSTNTYTVYFNPILEPENPSPTPPDRAAEDVLSIFSSHFENLSNVNFNPNWGQSTKVSRVTISGEEVFKYTNFNYQGIDLNKRINVSEMDYLHIDVWTANASSINLFAISPGPSETPVSLSISKGEWKSYDIPLSSYSSVVDLTNIFQFKFDDSGRGDKPTFYFDNLYFYKGAPNANDDATLKEIKIDDVHIPYFKSTQFDYEVTLPSNSTQVPKISVALSDTNATYTIEPNSTLPGSTKINVLAENAKTTKTYTIDFVMYSDISDPTLSSITVNGKPINHFNSLRKNYVFNLGDQSSRPVVSATASSADASITYFESNDYTYIKSISSDQQDSAIYSVFFRPQNLIWWDDFSSTSLNLNNWTYEIGNGCNQGENLCGWGNQELQSYEEENISIEQIPGEEGNNALVITAMKEGNNNFTSGRITSQDNVHFQYGVIEIRMKVPEVETGLWPAVWFLGGNHPEVGWPKSGEIDLMEMGQKKSFRTQQGYPNSSANQYVGSNIIWYSSAACVTGNETCAAAIAGDVNYNNPYVSNDNLNERFQVYRLYWSKNHIRLTVQDGGNEHNLYTAPFGTTSNELRNAFNQDFFMILNLAVGGNFTDALSANQVTASLPAKMYIDYVRLYQYNGEGSVLIDGETLTSNEHIFEEFDYPKSYKLFQNYPNPFNPATSIEFELQKTSNVQILVRDVLGRLVSDEKMGFLSSGRHNFRFDASNLSSGLYFYSLTVNGQLMDTKKMVLLK